MRIDFPELGDGFFVEIKDPKRMRWAEQKAITAAFKTDDIDSQLDVAEKIAVYLVKSGYVLDSDDKPIQFPLNVESVGDVPATVIEGVAKKFSEVKAKTKN